MDCLAVPCPAAANVAESEVTHTPADAEWHASHSFLTQEYLYQHLLVFLPSLCDWTCIFLRLVGRRNRLQNQLFILCFQLKKNVAPSCGFWILYCVASTGFFISRVTSIGHQGLGPAVAWDESDVSGRSFLKLSFFWGFEQEMDQRSTSEFRLFCFLPSGGQCSIFLFLPHPGISIVKIEFLKLISVLGYLHFETLPFQVCRWKKVVTSRFMAFFCSSEPLGQPKVYLSNNEMQLFLRICTRSDGDERVRWWFSWVASEPSGNHLQFQWPVCHKRKGNMKFHV